VSIPIFSVDESIINIGGICNKDAVDTSEDEIDEIDSDLTTKLQLDEKLTPLPDPVAHSNTQTEIHLSPGKPSTPKWRCRKKGSSGRTRMPSRQRQSSKKVDQRLKGSKREFDGMWHDEKHAVCIKWKPG